MKHRIDFSNSKIIFMSLIILQAIDATYSLEDIQANIPICNLEIYTISSDNKIKIFNNCEIEKSWRDTMPSGSDESRRYRIYEDENIIRRSFTVDYSGVQKNYEENQVNDSLTITKLNIEKNNQQEMSLDPVIRTVPFPFILKMGNSFDFIIEYNCLEIDPNSDIKMWDEIIIRIEIEENAPLIMKYVKICSNEFKNSPNFSYAFLMIIFLVVSLICQNDFLIKSNFVQLNIEEILQAKNVEKIFIYTLIIIAVLIFLVIIGHFYKISFVSGLIIGIISCKSFIRLLFSHFCPIYNAELEYRTFYISNVKLNYAKAFCYFISVIMFLLWYFTTGLFEILLSNFISFIISYYVIHKLDLKRFMFILASFSILILYDIILSALSLSPDDVFHLTSQRMINMPIRFYIPNISNTPFDVSYFFSILDLIFIGLALRYLKNSSSFNSKYYSYGKLCLYCGMVLNLFTFYSFKFILPVFLLPGIIIMLVAIIYSIAIGEFLIFKNLDTQGEHLKSKMVKEIPLNIIGADHSDDYANVNKEYIPPHIFQVKSSSYFNSVEEENHSDDQDLFGKAKESGTFLKREEAK